MSDLYRPKLHFTPQTGWMNDPNGLVFYGGEYHLFYQHNPYAPKWDRMHWGHAVSKDLYHWKHLPIAIYPDEEGEIYSGSCFFDAENVSGLGTNEEPPLLAFYTSHHPETKREEQCLAYSLDGRTFVKYAENPLIPGREYTPARDPQVFKNPVRDGYVMCITTEKEIEFYVSDNLLDWRRSGCFSEARNAAAAAEAGASLRVPEEIYECPCMTFYETEEGLKAVLMISTITCAGARYAREVRYFVGRFNGYCFVQEEFANEDLLVDYGPDFYAATVFSNVDKTIMLAWLGNSDYVADVPTDKEGFRGVLTLPRELSLVKTAAGYRLKSRVLPHAEVDVSRVCFGMPEGSRICISCDTLLEKTQSTGVDTKTAGAEGNTGEITISATEKEYIIDRSKAGNTSFNPRFEALGEIRIPRNSALANTQKNGASETEAPDWKVLIDGCVMEVIADAGLTCATLYIFPSSRSHSLV